MKREGQSEKSKEGDIRRQTQNTVTPKLKMIASEYTDKQFNYLVLGFSADFLVQVGSGVSH